MFYKATRLAACGWPSTPPTLQEYAFRLGLPSAAHARVAWIWDLGHARNAIYARRLPLPRRRSRTLNLASFSLKLSTPTVPPGVSSTPRVACARKAAQYPSRRLHHHVMRRAQAQTCRRPIRLRNQPPDLSIFRRAELRRSRKRQSA